MKAAGLENQILVTSFLKFFGIGESKLAEILRDLMQSPSPTVAPYVGEAEVKIRVSCKGLSEDEARKEMQPVKEEIIRRCKPYFFGEDEETLPSCVCRILHRRPRQFPIDRCSRQLSLCALQRGNVCQ
jgi:nicotinamide-nucleotide amidase